MMEQYRDKFVIIKEQKAPTRLLNRATTLDDNKFSRSMSMEEEIARSAFTGVKK